MSAATTITAMPVHAPPEAGARYGTARLTLGQFEAMIDADILTEADRVELIEGRLVQRMPPKPRHSALVTHVADVLRGRLPAGWHVRQEQPIRLPGSESMPQPDAAIARGRAIDWIHRFPGPDALALVVEVADSSVQDDRGLVSAFLGGGVATYWIVNVKDRQIEAHGRADVAGSPARVYLPGEDVPLAIEGREVARIPVAELLPEEASEATGPAGV